MGDKTMRLRKWRCGEKSKKSSKKIGNFGFQGFRLINATTNHHINPIYIYI